MIGSARRSTAKGPAVVREKDRQAARLSRYAANDPCPSFGLLQLSETFEIGVLKFLLRADTRGKL